jgi:methylmalonyl-CoA decarboxylase
MSLVLTEFSELIGTITFNNNEKRNCLSAALLKKLITALKEMRNHKARVIILRAAKGAKVWSAGLDVNELPDPGRDPFPYDDPFEQAGRSIQRFPAPVIAMIEGSVWGAACDLAFSCDILIGTHSTFFAMTPAKIGIPYSSSGLLHFIYGVGLPIAKEMFFTAQPVAAERAEKLGILNHLVPEAELEAFTYKMARQITQNSPLSISAIKEQLRILADSHPLSPGTFERIQGLRRRVYDSQDYLEGKNAFLQKRSPVFQGE